MPEQASGDVLAPWRAERSPFPSAVRVTALEGDPDGLAVSARLRAPGGAWQAVDGALEVSADAVIVRRGDAEVERHPLVDVRWAGFGEEPGRDAGRVVLHVADGAAVRLPTVMWPAERRAAHVEGFRWFAAAVTARAQRARGEAVSVPSGVAWEIEQARWGGPSALALTRQHLDGAALVTRPWLLDAALAPVLVPIAAATLVFGSAPLVGLHENGLMLWAVLGTCLGLISVPAGMRYAAYAERRRMHLSWDARGFRATRWRSRHVAWGRIREVAVQVGGVIPLTGMRRHSLLFTLDDGSIWRVDTGAYPGDPDSPTLEHLEWVAERAREHLHAEDPHDVPDALRALATRANERD